MKLENSKDIYNRAVKSIPGGVNSPVRAFQSVEREFPIFVKGANGPIIVDEDDNEYVDFIGSWGPMILGHNDARVVGAVMEELNMGSSYGLPTKNEVVLAEMVKEIYPSIDKIRLTSSGTEATMAAIRVARAYTKRNKILKFEGCYHGHSDALMVKAGSGLLTNGTQDSNGITEGVMKDTLTIPFGSEKALREIFEKYKDDLACIIVEPIPGNMGLIIPDIEYLKLMRSLTDEYGIVLIYDEVISGFRASLSGAQGLFGIEPDLTTLGKIIGGGYPCGAFGGKKEIMDMIAPIGNVYHAGTLSGNPISVRAGIETIKILKEDKDIYPNLEKNTRVLVDKIRGLAKKNNLPIVINQLGSLFTIYFTTNEEVTGLEDVVATDDRVYARYFSLMLEEGIVVPPSKYEAHFVSIKHDDAIMTRVLESIDRVFAKLGE